MRLNRKLLVAYGLEAALAASLLTLMVQLAWPTLVAWQNRPRPGRMVVQPRTNASATPLAGLANEYQLYLPRGFDATTKNKTWPLILYLHGAGERGWDPRDVKQCGLPLRLGDDFHLPAVVVVPQCPPDQRWVPEGLVKLIDEIEQRLPIDRRRLYVMGYSMGGFGAWALACYAPDRIAAAVILAGGGRTNDVKRARGVDVWLLHGSQDAAVPSSASQDTAAALQAIGGKVRYTLLEGQGHGIQDLPLTRPDIFEWLFQQRKTNPDEAAPELDPDNSPSRSLLNNTP